MRSAILNLLAAFVGAGVTFGPLFMTNIGGSATRDMTLVGSLMLSIALIRITWDMREQAREIERLKKIVEGSQQS